jgi:hypothetical protein
MVIKKILAQRDEKGRSAEVARLSLSRAPPQAALFE